MPVFPKLREHHMDQRSIQLTPEAIARYDAVVLLTDHSEFDYELIAEHAKLLVDTRGKYRRGSARVVRA